MSTDIVQQQGPAIEKMVSPEFAAQIRTALPESVSEAKFLRVAQTAYYQTPGLAEADPQSLLLALIQCAQTGLMPDGKKAALVIYNTKTKVDGRDVWVKKVQCIPMIAGYREIAAEHGWTIRTGVVREADEFDYVPSEGQLFHRPPRPGVERGDKIAAYAKAVHRDGRVEIEVMDAEQIAKVRKASRASDRGPWVDWEDEMWEKSPGRRIFKKLALSETDRRVANLIAADALENGEAATALYGPSETPAALPAGDTSGVSTTSRDASGTADVAGDHQQAEPAAATATPAAGSAPDLDPDFADDADDEMVAAAKDAHGFVVPFGTTWKGKTLADVHASGETGRQWFAKMLEKLDAARYPEFRTAVWAFARVYLPDEYQVALEREEAQAA